jgi:hypothetical protein
MADYRKIWSDYYGPIPVDENGVTYDIHHIDGDRNNNNIFNLIALPLKEHYQIHYDKGEYCAAHLISQRLNMTPEERAHINKKISEFKTGKPLSEYHKSRMKKPKTEETKMRMRKPKSEEHKNKIKEASIGKVYSHIECPHCGIKTASNNAKKYHFDKCPKYAGDIRPVYTCPHCLKKGKGSAMKQWHFDRCRYKK